ncbi:MAG: flagellar protein FlaG [Clostridiales bacterium]|nr:flagellar protein FlaG [Clostridiales bacterium]
MRVEGVSTVTTVKSIPRVQSEAGQIGLKKSDTSVLNDKLLNKNIAQDDVLQAVKQANKALEGTNRRFEYSVHEQTKTLMIKVINSDTDEIIREIPPEKILDLIAKLWELTGLIVDEKM